MDTININNESLTYNKIIYVDAVNGDDTNGDGSEGKPYATLQVAVDNASADNAIKLGEGVYNFSEMQYLVTTNKLAFIGNGKNTIINLLQHNQSSSLTTGYAAYFYNLIFRPDDSFGGGDLKRILLTSSTGYILRFFNVGFVKSLNGSYPTKNWFTWSLSGGSNQDVIFENCFAEAAPDNFEFLGGTQQQYINCAFDNQSLPVDGTTENCLSGVSFDSIYQITSSGWENTGTGTNPDGSQANIGVYGGSYAWGDWSLAVGIFPAFSITSTSVALEGELLGLGDYTSADCFFEYTEDSNFENNIQSTASINLSAKGTFSKIIEGLDPNTKYYYRAGATGKT